MTTTLSDEEFQRLNDQLLELKTKNYNLEASLTKSVQQCGTLKNENEQLTRQLDNLSVTDGAPPHGQSIKQKFNRFLLAKNIANKIDSRLHSLGQPQQQQIPLKETNGTEANFAHRLESQELDFLKTNETLKNEINLLQSQLEQSEATNKQLRDQFDLLSSQQKDVETKTYEPETCNASRQLQQSLEIFSAAIRDRQQHFISNIDYKQQISKLLASLESEDTKHLSTIVDSIVSIFDMRICNNTDALKNTTEDFKQICDFFDKLHQTHLDRAKELITSLCYQFIDYEKQQHKLIESEKIRAAELSEQVDQLQIERTTLQKELNESKDQSERIIDQLRDQLKNETIKAADDATSLAVQSCKQEQDLVVNELNAKLHNYKTQIESVQAQFEQAQKQIESLNAKIGESINEHKISEKRGFKIIKELKKQLNAEKSRADKLQAILNTEEFSESAHKSLSNSPKLRTKEGTNVLSDKCSSSGSWSYMNEDTSAPKARQGSVHSTEFSDIEIVHQPRVLSEDGELATSSDSTLGQKKKSRGIPVGSLEYENAQLVARVSNLQQEKWRLEEQLHECEQELSKLRTELADKSKLIAHYCIEGRVEQNGPSPAWSPGSRGNTRSASISSPPSSNNSVLRMVTKLKSELVTNPEGAKQLADVNRKLQRMVEETLTKNMHLQGNLEEMSHQLMDARTRLQKYEQI